MADLKAFAEQLVNLTVKEQLLLVLQLAQVKLLPLKRKHLSM